MISDNTIQEVASISAAKSALRTEAKSDDETRRMLVAIMNRYDLRPSDAGRLLCAIDHIADSYQT